MSTTDPDLPPSWLAVTLGQVVNYGATEKAEPEEITPETWVLELEDVERDSSRVLQRVSFSERRSKSTKNRFSRGDVLYGKLRPYLNKVVYADAPGVCTTEIVPIKPGPALAGRYLFHWLRHPEFLRYVTDVSHGVNMPRLGTEAGLKAPFVLAPLREQHRIADKLDTVLARVDACRDRLARVAPLLKRFRQSVLASATSGRLTAEWRETNTSHLETAQSLTTVKLPTGYRRLSKQAFKPTKIAVDVSDLPSNWLICTVGELYKAGVLIDFADGNHGSLYPRKEEFGSEGALFLTATQMDEKWRVDLRDCPRLEHHKAKKLMKGWAKHGDVLLSHNATVGRVGILNSKDEDVLLGTSVTFYRFNTQHFCAHYARVLFSSLFFQDQLRSVMTQTTRDQVPITKQVSLSLLVPPLAEQVEIARRVETLFAFADRFEARLSQAQTAVDRLTPSLLAKAFRGELVPQGPADEPAAELLKRLAAQRATVVTEPGVRQSRRARVPRVPKKAAAMTKSRQDLDVMGQPYLAKHLRQLAVPASAEALFKLAELPVADFYKQLAWEVAQGHIKDNQTSLEPGRAA